jgi:hypothetical protein
MIRNLGEDQQGLGKGQGDEEEKQGCPQQEGDQVRLATIPSRVLGLVCTKIDAWDTTRLRLCLNLIWLETKRDYLTNPTGPTLKSIRSQREPSKQFKI